MTLHHFATIDSDELSTISGGASVDLRANTRWGNVDASFHSKNKPDTNPQLRCYQQVASQAGWFQASRETLRQQVELCGPLQQRQ